jgi:hypothetical protein
MKKFRFKNIIGIAAMLAGFASCSKSESGAGTAQTASDTDVNFWKSRGKKGGTYVKNGSIWTLE